jgi:hypothetical protein
MEATTGSFQKFSALARKLVNVQRDELRREEERYKIENATRRRRQSEEDHMRGRRVKVRLPTGDEGEGTEVQVDESNERWSEFKFSDGTVVRAKVTVVSAVRVDGHFDQFGNPLYSTNFSPVMTIVNVPEQYRKKE